MVISDAPIAFGARGTPETLARLLGSYPSERLIIFQMQGFLPAPERRIARGVYHRWTLPWDRLLRTRLSVPANIVKALYHIVGCRSFVAAARGEAPDAILTIVTGNGWVLARRTAERLRIPLHLIVHDAPSHFQLDYPITGPWLTREFGLACRQAASRWSICSALERHIAQLTGVPGLVLPPLRDAADRTPPGLPEKLAGQDAVYFGALTSVSITSMMNDLARVLANSGGSLHAFGGVSPNVAVSRPWKDRQFEHHGAFDDRNQFLEHCRRSYAFMFLPFSFEDESTRFSFPSKLVDYTLTGLPILVQAPAWSPVGVWCNDNPHAALFVPEVGPEALRLPVQALVGDDGFRSRLAVGALTAGERDFGFETNWTRFFETICDGFRTEALVSS